MVKELSDKHKRAINAGRLAAGYPKIKWKKNDKKKTKEKTQYAKSIKDLKKGIPLNPKSQKKVDAALADLYRRSKGKFGMKKNEV